MHENEISEKIIEAAIEVYRILGSGLLDSVYEKALCLNCICELCTVALQINHHSDHIWFGFVWIRTKKCSIVERLLHDGAFSL